MEEESAGGRDGPDPDEARLSRETIHPSWDTNGVWTPSDITPSPDPFSLIKRTTATSLSDNGNVTGFADLGAIDGLLHVPFLWSNGSFHGLGNMPGTDASYGEAVNSQGQIVGYGESFYSPFPKPDRIFIWQDGHYTDLGRLYDAQFSRANAINNRGQVVGQSLVAFLYDDGTMYDLNTLVDSDSAGWKLIEARDVNDRGQIVGIGINPAGQTNGFLANPIPEPVVLVPIIPYVVLRPRRHPHPSSYTRIS